MYNNLILVYKLKKYCYGILSKLEFAILLNFNFYLVIIGLKDIMNYREEAIK